MRIFLLALMIILSIVSTRTTCFSEGEPGRALERDCKHQVLYMELGGFVPFFPPHCACFIEEVSVGVYGPSKPSCFPILPLSLSDSLRVQQPLTVRGGPTGCRVVAVPREGLDTGGICFSVSLIVHSPVTSLCPFNVLGANQDVGDGNNRPRGPCAEQT